MSIGAINIQGTGADLVGDNNPGNLARSRQLYFDASKSSNIYGAANTVQPPAIQLIPQIKF